MIRVARGGVTMDCDSIVEAHAAVRILLGDNPAAPTVPTGVPLADVLPNVTHGEIPEGDH